MFVLYNKGIKALCTITQEQPTVYEMKNMVAHLQYQRKGHG